MKPSRPMPPNGPLDTLNRSPFGHKKPYLRLQKPRARNWPQIDIDLSIPKTVQLRITFPFPWPSTADRPVPQLLGGPVSCLKTGGGGRDRTDDLKLAKLALSQLSYAPGFNGSPAHMDDKSNGKWWAREDLNLRPHAYQACALTN